MITGNLAGDLLKELNCDTAFTIPVFGGIKVPESVVVTWIIMAVLLIVSFLLTRNLSVENPGRRQKMMEAAVSAGYGFFEDILGEEGKEYINLIGLVGLKPPTKDMGVTAGLAVMSIILIEMAGIRKKGTKGWLKSFAQPVWVIAPINILEVFIRPLSLCMRLFGNVLGAFVVMELIKLILPVLLPIPFSFYFDIFDGLIQAYVFVFLTSLFLKEALE